ncbi:hypothetical protein ABZV34_27025 [Streptomyces sp. NPDC005195]|uniref:hypothetical protein n=1 Tax=Streptomyces sp. NPDC005195 TaxID=3154561 RepID=UPI0033AF38B7
MRWLMTLGERTRPDTPAYAECPPPGQARASALVDDCGQLFPIVRAWARQFNGDVTAWAAQVEVDDIEHLPRQVTEEWDPLLRLDTQPGGYVVVTDYRDHQNPTADARQRQVKSPGLDSSREILP